MKIEIICKNEIYCDLMQARVRHALESLHMDADMEFVMDHVAQNRLDAEAKAGLIIDDEMIAIGTGHTIEEIQRMLSARRPSRH